ncbi:GGDEF domain-containing protein [Klebsiella sp. BIGb0407]|uniref:GGDEF domain-containing protein n=1 Tax=Klebsiella sp. BIGb0407 TaxID=2940603 RepID=UPI002168C767|nr:GGDEF domain-containing protein [Klebsiella sp. BIGb0407]MCS3432682.1 diguanylate cyclase (GGDEF)-like protein [Klebsiella sp. BIGb0407]
MKFALNNEKTYYGEKELRRRKFITRGLLTGSIFLLLVVVASLTLAMKQARIFSTVHYYADTWYISNVSSELYRLMLSAYEIKSEDYTQGKDEMTLRLDILYAVLSTDSNELSYQTELKEYIPDAENVFAELKSMTIYWSDLLENVQNDKDLKAVSDTIIADAQPLRLKINTTIAKFNQSYNQKEVEQKKSQGKLAIIFIFSFFILLVGIVLFIWRLIKNHQVTEAMADTLREANYTLEERVKERTLALQYMASTDELTGIYNRRAFIEKTESLIIKCNKLGLKYGLLMLDIDNFKSVNDHYGHLVGDEVIKNVGTSMRYVFLESGIFGRIGGEEFAAILPLGKKPDLLEIAEKIRSHIEEDVIIVNDELKISVTVSIGIAYPASPNETLTQLLSNADVALYRSKKAGRNKVSQFNDGSNDPHS